MILPDWSTVINGVHRLRGMMFVWVWLLSSCGNSSAPILQEVFLSPFSSFSKMGIPLKTPVCLHYIEGMAHILVDPKAPDVRDEPRYSSFFTFVPVKENKHPDPKINIESRDPNMKSLDPPGQVVFPFRESRCVYFRLVRCGLRIYLWFVFLRPAANIYLGFLFLFSWSPEQPLGRLIIVPRMSKIFFLHMFEISHVVTIFTPVFMSIYCFCQLFCSFLCDFLGAQAVIYCFWLKTLLE